MPSPTVNTNPKLSEVTPDYTTVLQALFGDQNSTSTRGPQPVAHLGQPGFARRLSTAQPLSFPTRSVQFATLPSASHVATVFIPNPSSIRPSGPHLIRRLAISNLSRGLKASTDTRPTVTNSSVSNNHSPHGRKRSTTKKIRRRQLFRDRRRQQRRERHHASCLTRVPT